jgi:Single Cache domain 2
MIRIAMIGSLVTLTMALANAAFAQSQLGTAAEAKAMLEKAVAAVSADKSKALEMFNNGEGGFKDRDLYPFCFNISDGIGTAGPTRGKDVRTLKDPSGKAFGEELYKVAQEGKLAEVSYMFPRPGETTPTPKVSFVMKAGDQGCGVGYYK